VVKNPSSQVGKFGGSPMEKKMAAPIFRSVIAQVLCTMLNDKNIIGLSWSTSGFDRGKR